MKKQKNILIMAMLVLGMLQIIMPPDDVNVNAGTPDDGVDGLQYIDGDWYVNGSESYTNETIVLSGNLTINPGASLILRNVTLAMNCSTENGTYTINVWGSLDISDYDNDPSTTNDRSNITDSPFDADDRSPGDYKTALKAYSGASISITNSIIQDYGYSGGVDSYGIYTNFVDYVNIQNCTIENGLYGVYIDRGSNSRVNHNEIRYCDESAIYMSGDSYADILNNNIHHCDKGAFIGKWYSIVANNYIHNNSNVYDVNEQNQVGLRLQSADYCRVFNNTLEYNGKNWYGYTFQTWGCDYLKVYNNTFKNGKPGAGYSVLIQSSSDLTMYNNTIMNNPYTGVYLYSMSGNAKFYNNTIINNSNNGMYLQSFYPPTNFLIKDNYLDKNGWGIRFRQMRAYNITNNKIMNCTGYGIYIDDVLGGKFSNNTITALGPDFHLQDSFGDPDTVFEVLNCSFEPTETEFGSVGPELVIYNYLHINVTDAGGWVPGAYIVVSNNTGWPDYEGVSDENGRVGFIPVKNMTITYYENISYDPVNITATLDGYEAYGEIEPIMDKSRTVNVHFYDDLPPLPPPFLNAVSNLTNVELNWEPSPSNDVSHYLVYRNATGGSWQLVYDSSTSPGKELWTNWTDYHAASDWVSYRYYVTTVDMFPQESVSSNIARCGDWVVNSTKTVTDLSALLNGSLIILSTGNLSLENAKIEFNCSFDGEYGIEVLPDGKLWILDNDNNPLTIGDRSDVYAINYSFYFEMQGIEFVMKNSKLSKCGLNENLQYSYWDHEFKGPEIMTVGEPSTRGLYIGSLTQTIIIENNEFSNNFVSVLIDGNNNASITGNTFSSNTFGIYLSNSKDNTIYDNTFTGHTGFPMYLFNSRTNNITYNDITNPSNTEAGIALNDDYCISNTFFYNDFSGGKYGIVAFDSGNLNNISHNNFSSQWTGIYLRDTYWARIFDNDFDDTSSYDCNLESASFSRIFGGTSNLADIGLYLVNSHNVLIWDLVVENATSSGIQLIDSNNLIITNVTMKSCGKGIDIGGGNTISMNEITMEDCTTGLYISSNPWNAELIDSAIYLGTSTAIFIMNTDDFIITDCYLNATNYNFDLDNAKVTSYNTTFDQSKITLDSTSSISLWWRVDVRVFHWLGNPQQGVEVQIRNVAGTLIHTAWTDINGYIGWIWMHERIQFSTSKESYTPHSFHGIWGNHAGSNGLILNQSTLVTVWLENLPPTVSNVQITPTSPTTVDALDLSYMYSDDEGDPEGSTQILWYTDGVHNTTLNDQMTISGSITRKGQTWFCEVIPHDGTVYGIPMTSTPVTIQNTPPVVSNVVIVESNPSSSNNLHISYDFTDIDNDEEFNSQYRWWVDNGTGFIYSGVDSLELSSINTKKGEIWKCIVTPNDGDDFGISVESNNVTIGNSPPEVTNVIILPENPKSNETLSVNYDYFDLDNDGETGSTIQWYKNGILQTGLNDNPQVDFSLTQKNEVWYYIVTPSDGGDFGASVQSAIVSIGNTPPTVTNIMISPLTPTTLEDISVTYDFYDYDGDSESLDTVIKWLRWSVSDFFDTGYRGQTLPSSATSKGEIWTCEIIPHDGKSEGVATRSLSSVGISNSPPSAFNTRITPANPTAESNLTVNYDYSDPDSDGESGSIIRWYKDGFLQHGLNDSLSVNYILTNVNELWYYVVTPSDGEDFGTPVQSTSVTIGNTPPTVSNIVISPSNPITADDLIVTYDFYDYDGNSESLDTVIRWLRWSGTVFFDTGLRGKTLPSYFTSKGEIWMCEVIPHDGFGQGAPVLSGMNVTIGNSGPEAINCVISPENPDADSDLWANYQYVDPDSDPEVGSTIRWYKDDVLQSALNDSQTVNYTLTLKGEKWYYNIIPSDGEDFGASIQSKIVYIGNTPPMVSNIVISPSNPQTGDGLSVTYDFYDADGDSESLDTTVRWLRWSGTYFFDTGHRGKTLSWEHTLKGDIWTCDVIPHDGLNEGLATRSDMNVTIENSAPIVLSASVTPADPTADSVLYATYNFWDPDSDSEYGSTIRWYKNNILQPGLNDSISVDFTLTNGNEVWYYIVTPSDGEDIGASLQSDTVTIGNTPPEVYNIAISPQNPNTENDLSVTYNFYDFDGDLESLDTVVKWLRWSGAVFFDTGLRGKILTSDYTSKGEIWTCEIIPHDGVEEGAAFRCQNNITIGNSMPIAQNVVIIPINPDADSNLTANYDYFDHDSDSESGSLIKWYKNDIEQVVLQGSFSVDHSLTQKGDVWYYNITPFDGEDYGSPIKSDNVTIGNTPPSVTNIIISPASPTAEDDLTVSYDFYDSDGDSESLDTIIKWLRWNGAFYEDTGYRGKTLSSAYTSKGEIWMCEVRPHDGLDGGVAVLSSSVVTITNSRPSASNAYISPDGAQTGSILQANYDYSDLDYDLEIGTEIMWFRNGVQVDKLDNKFTVPSSHTAKGEVWNFTVRPSDGTDYGKYFKSTNITIQNTKPTALNLSITANPKGDDDLVASYEFFDVDSDSQQGAEIRWFKNGIYQSKYDDVLIVNSVDTKKGELWYFTLKVFDGEDYSDLITSYYVEVENSKPVIKNITPELGDIQISETESYEFQVDVEDPDGDLLLIKWRLDKTTVGDSDYYLFETDYTSAGTYILNLTIKDVGENSATLSNEWQIIVLNVNLPPHIEVKEPTVNNPKMREGDSLKFIIDESDPDAEDKPQVTWYFNDGVAQSGGSSYTYFADDLAAGDHIVKAIVDDGEDSVEYAWNLSVADVSIEKEELFGFSYDAWGLILAVISGIAAILLFVIGFIRVKKKKGALKTYMAEIDEISTRMEDDPVEYDYRLMELENKIHNEFKSGHIEDLHYMMLQDIISSRRGEARKAEISQKFDRLPEGVVKNLDEMLKDGKISREEYEGFVATISKTATLSPYEKKELFKMIEKWEDEDKELDSDKSSKEKAEPRKIEDEIDNIMEDLNEKENVD